mgnify:FL=1
MFVVNNSVCVVKNIKLFGFMLLTASEFIVNQQNPFSYEVKNISYRRDRACGCP